MKTYRGLIIGFALLAAVSASAQDVAERSSKDNFRFGERSVRVPDLRKAEAHYLISLDSDNPGVVESALGHVTLMRIEFPTQDLGKIQLKLYSLASRGATKSIRQKAFIAMQVFADPLAYREAAAGKQASGDGLLEALAAQL